MNISLWDHLNERHSDKLTHTQRTIRHGVMFALAVILGGCLKMLIDAWLGQEIELDESLAIGGGGLSVAVIGVVIELVRGPRPGKETEPELYLTDDMRRCIR